MRGGGAVESLVSTVECAVPDLRTLLDELGYVLTPRADGFVEVLVERDAERWLGRGHDADAALADVVAQMFPSHAARQGLASLLEQAEPAEAIADPEPADEHEVVECEQDEAVGEPPSRAVVEPEPGTSEAESGPKPGEVIELPHRAPDEALTEVQGILAEIQEAEEEIALMAPRLVQLHMLSWICRGREQQSEFPNDARVRRTVASIASHLGRLANRYWPGNVPALRANTAPSATQRVLGVPETPSTWREAAEAADDAIAELLANPDFDEDGWRDRERLRPRPNDPERLLASLLADVEGLTGSLEVRKDRQLEENLHQLDAGQVERLGEIGQLARWLRLGQPDAVAWGSLMGRLRWAAHKLGSAGAPLTEVLDPTYRPPAPWASHLTRQSEAEQRARDRARLHRGRPWTSGPIDADTVLAWVVEAFAAFDTDEIAALVAEVREVVEAVADEQLASLTRGQRRRYRSLMKHLAADSVRDVVVDEVPEAPPAVEPARELRPDPGEQLVASIRAEVEGQQALFVSNRDDAILKERLEEAFGFALDWLVADPRKIQAASKRIEHGTYDLVIAATGFMHHKDDRALSLACSARDTPYVRAYRGRTQATAKALARTLGLDAR